MGIAASGARNHVARETHAFTQNTTITTPDLTIVATSSDELGTLANGSNGSLITLLDVAGSATWTTTENSTGASIGENTTAVVTGDIVVQAEELTTVISSAGITSATAFGVVALGPAIDRVELSNTVHASVGSNAVITVGEDLHVVTTSQGRVHSESASLGNFAAGGIAASGSVASLLTNVSTNARIESDSDVTAGGSIVLQAKRDIEAFSHAGGDGRIDNCRNRRGIGICRIDRCYRSFDRGWCRGDCTWQWCHRARTLGRTRLGRESFVERIARSLLKRM